MVQNTTSGMKNTNPEMQKNNLGSVSVVIPVYSESEIINACIWEVVEFDGEEPSEVIVSDGGPDHLTLEAIEAPGVIKVKSPPGRGTQMNAGAGMATGDILFFLHVDTDLPHGAVESVRRAVQGGAVAGAFSLSIDSPKWSLKIISWFANLRSRLERVPYGDQAQFITADLFRELGGFADIPIMEDVELFRKIRKLGLPIVILRDRVKTSARRWEKEGILRRTLTNWWLRIRYRFGTSPETLKLQYRPHDHGADDKLADDK